MSYKLREPEWPAACECKYDDERGEMDRDALRFSLIRLRRAFRDSAAHQIPGFRDKGITVECTNRRRNGEAQKEADEPFRSSPVACELRKNTTQRVQQETVLQESAPA